MNDIILLHVPYTLIEFPPLGIAVLKGALEYEGLTAKTIDLGMELYKDCNRNKELFESLQEYFIIPEYDNRKQSKDIVDNFLNKWAMELAYANTRYVGFSVFSHYSHLATYILAKKIKDINPNVKIIIGGPGSSIGVSSDMEEYYKINDIDKTLHFGDLLKKRKIIDNYIIGDGEQALIDLLKLDKFNSQFQSIDYQKIELPFANFDDINLIDYEGNLGRGVTQIPIFSSKGCVRKCDFCNVGAVQGDRFRFRTGKNIVNEMIFLSKKYGIRDFVFLDSLVNGSLKSLLEWTTALAEYNEKNPDEKITWTGQWICRPIGQLKEHVYEIIAKSGCTALSIGVESGSNRVLEAMDKKTNVEALHYEIEQFQKYNIKFITQLIVGHWAEEWEDFVDTCSMVYRLTPQAKTGLYFAAGIGSTYSIGRDTPSDRYRNDNKLEGQGNLWWTLRNPSLTAKERYFRLLILDKLINKLGIPALTGTIPGLYLSVDKNKNIIEEYYKNKIKNLDVLPKQFAEYYYTNFDQFFEMLVKKNQKYTNNLTIDIEVESSTTDDRLPKFEILYNNDTIISKSLTDGEHSFSYTTPTEINKVSDLVLKFSNKLSNDTIVDEYGNIIKDKYVKLKKLSINNIDLLLDQNFFYNKLKYTEGKTVCQVKAGFWSNDSTLTINFTNPFIVWYAQNTNNYTTNDVVVITSTTIPANKITMPEDEYRARFKKLLSLFTY